MSPCSVTPTLPFPSPTPPSSGAGHWASPAPKPAPGSLSLPPWAGWEYIRQQAASLRRVHAPHGPGGGAPAHWPGHARCGAARGRASARGAVILRAGRRPQLHQAVPAPPSPAPRPHHGAGVGGRGPAEPLPGGLCGEPEQVPAEAGHLGR